MVKDNFTEKNLRNSCIRTLAHGRHRQSSIQDVCSQTFLSERSWESYIPFCTLETSLRRRKEISQEDPPSSSVMRRAFTLSGLWYASITTSFLIPPVLHLSSFLYHLRSLWKHQSDRKKHERHLWFRHSFIQCFKVSEGRGRTTLSVSI